jgi:hypothetical protein
VPVRPLGGMRSAMRSCFPFAAAVMTSGILAACAYPLLAPDDRKNFCDFAVEENFGSLEFHPNIYSSAAGALAGAGEGALAGSGSGYFAIIMVPIGALIGAAAGASCAAAGLSHPNAEADFERFLLAADASALKSALEADLNAPRAECRRPRADVFGMTAPDALVAIEKIEFQMGCLLGRQEYWITVQWHTTSAKSQRVLNSSTTKCMLTSFHDVDEWFAHPERAKAEIEGLLTRTGQRMAGLLLSDNLPYECKLRSLETGEVVAK